MNKPCSIALLVDGPELQAWERRAVDHLLDNRNVKIGAVIQKERPSTQKSGFSFRKIIQNISFWTLYSAFRRLIWVFRGQPWYRETLSIPESESATKLRVTPRDSEGLGNKLPDRAVTELQKHDVAIRFGFGILKGEAMNAPKKGVLSFHHGDLRKYRGRPAGFWELIEGESVVGITVQRLSETLDGGKIVVSTNVRINETSSWPKVLDRLFKHSEPLLTEAFEKICTDEGGISPKELGELYTIPEWRDLLQYGSLRLQSVLKI